MAVAHNCTCTSGILEANCIAGVTIFIDSLLFPNERNICPKSTRLHEVSLFKSSEFAIFNVSLRYRLKIVLYIDTQIILYITENKLFYLHFSTFQEIKFLYILLIRDMSINLGKKSYFASLYLAPKKAWSPCT